ncbi:MAG: DoxX family protein [Acidobacteriota bacterium]|jgi:putative oxidoreductase
MRSLKATFSPAAPYAMVPVRLILFAVFFYRGTQKLFGWFDGPGLEGTAALLSGLGVPLTSIAAPLVAVIQVVASVAFLVGAGVRFFGILIALLMVAACAARWTLGWDHLAAGIELNGTIIAMCLALLFGGPGWASIEWADEEGAAPGAVS